MIARFNRRKIKVGHQFGQLTVIALAPSTKSPNGTWRTKYLCRCQCGTEKVLAGRNLSGKQIKSCGCLKKRGWNRLPDGESAFNEVFYGFRQNAKERNFVWALDKRDVRIIIRQNCGYCGAPPSNLRNVKTSTGSICYNGLDRIDSTIGYTNDNVTPCCNVCNWMKSNTSVDKFVSHIQSIYNHFNKLQILINNT